MRNFWRNWREDLALALRLRTLAREHEGSPDLTDLLRAEVLRHTARGEKEGVKLTDDRLAA